MKTASATKFNKKDSFYLFTSIDLYVIIYIQITSIGEMIQMKINMINKITNWTEKLKDWTYKKKPSNKYLRIAYYFLTGLITFMVIPLTLIAAIFLFTVIIALVLLISYLAINYSFVRIIMALLVCLMFLITFSLIGYFEFGKD